MDPTLIAFLVYLGAVILIGILVTRFASRDLSHYFLANRGLGAFVVGMSAVASGRSAWTLLAYSGLAFIMGLSAVWATVGYIVIEAVLFVTVGKKLREQTGAQGDITIPDYFASRFPELAVPFRIFSALFIVFFLTSYVGSQLEGAGKALDTSFGVTLEWSIVISAGIILLYTILGGFLAVAITDVIQGLMMVGALIGLPAYVLAVEGGFGWLSEQLTAHPGTLDLWNIEFILLVSLVGIGLGSPGNPHIIVRYMSARSEKDMKMAAVIATAANILMAIGGTLIGLVGRAVYATLDHTDLAGDRERILPVLAGDYMHPLVYGVVLAAIFAAIMSTCDSQLLVSSSAVVRDLYQKIFKRGREIGQRQLVFLSRLTIGVLISLASVIAIALGKNVFDLTLAAWGGLGSAFGPALIFTLYRPQASGKAILAGLITGGLVAGLWGSATFEITVGEVSKVPSKWMGEWVVGFVISALTILVMNQGKGKRLQRS